MTYLGTLRCAIHDTGDEPPDHAQAAIMSSSAMHLVWPSERYLPGYVAALKRGWSAENVRGEAAAIEELEKIAKDPARFLAELVDREANGYG